MSVPVATGGEAAQDPGKALNPPITDWILRPFEAVPFSPIWLAIAIAAVHTATSLAMRELLGDPPSNLWVDALNAAIFAYIPTVLVYLRRGILRDLRELKPALTPGADLEAIAAEITCVPRRTLFWAGAIGFLVFALLPILDPSYFSDLRRPPFGDPFLTFFMIRSGLTGWMLGHALASDVRAAGGYASLGASKIEVDLLDTRPLHPFTRRGLRSALMYIAAISLVSLFYLAPGAGATNGPIMIAIVGWVTYSFFYSVGGVHRNIRRKKQGQLDALRSEIRVERAAITSGEREASDARLAGLIAYHDLIERAHEWPFGVPAMLRLALVLLLGLGSWLGGALVERLVENLGF